MLRKALAVCILFVSVLLAGCGGGSKRTASPSALTLTASAALPSAAMGAAYSQTLTATGGAAPYSWSVATGSTLPAGLVLNAASGALTGAPTAAGASTFSITVKDSSTPALTATATYTLSVSAAPIVISTTSLTAAIQGVAYTQTLGASGGTQPYTWIVATGSTLPDGLTLTGAGVLAGTPGTAGTFNFSLTVTDAGSPSLTATQAYSLSVAVPPVPPGPLAISTTTLPPANVNFSYSTTLAATGGVAPYTWTLVGDGPQGLTLNASTGIYSGTPAFPAPGPISIQLQVTDATATTATVILPLSVSPLGMLKGTYFFQINSALTSPSSGTTTNAFNQLLAGSIVLDGQGNVTGGSVDYADDDGDYFLSSGVSGTYLLESFGLGNTVIGLVGLNLPGLPDTGSNGPQYEFLLTAAARQQPSSGYDTTAILSQGDYDNQSVSQASFGSGSLKMQDPTAFSTFLGKPAVVFGWRGDTCQLCGASTQALDLAAAGRLTFDSNHTLTNTSAADIATGTATDNSVALTGGLARDVTIGASNTDTNFNLYGRATLSLTATGYTNGNLPSTMAVYVIDATHAYALTSASNSAPLLGGFLQPQDASAALAGSFVAWGTWQDAADSAAAFTSFTASDASISLYTAASGALTGAADIDKAGVTSTLTTAATFAVGADGRVTVTPTDSNPAPVFWLASANAGFGITQPTGSNGAPASLLTVEPMTLSSVTPAAITGAYIGGTLGSASYDAFSSVSLTQADGISAWGGVDLITSYGTTSDYFASLAGTYTVQPDGRGVLSQTATEDNGSSAVIFTADSPFYVLSSNRILVLDASLPDSPTITVYQQ